MNRLVSLRNPATVTRNNCVPPAVWEAAAI
jgi:hypothetical protein